MNTTKLAVGIKHASMHASHDGCTDANMLHKTAS